MLLHRSLCEALKSFKFLEASYSILRLTSSPTIWQTSSKMLFRRCSSGNAPAVPHYHNCIDPRHEHKLSETFLCILKVFLYLDQILFLSNEHRLSSLKLFHRKNFPLVFGFVYRTTSRLLQEAALGSKVSFSSAHLVKFVTCSSLQVSKVS